MRRPTTNDKKYKQLDGSFNEQLFYSDNNEYMDCLESKIKQYNRSVGNYRLPTNEALITLIAELIKIDKHDKYCIHLNAKEIAVKLKDIINLGKVSLPPKPFYCVDRMVEEDGDRCASQCDICKFRENEEPKNYISEEVFYDKELSDAIREIVKHSVLDYDRALKLLKLSKDYTRDVHVIKGMANVGIRIDQLVVTIKAINN